jgi:hypothetical protein
MFSKRTLYILMAVVVAVIAAGAFTAFAQDSDEPTSSPFNSRGHMMGMGYGMMWGSTERPGSAAVAEALGLDEASLTSELQSGKTIAQLAEEQGIDVATVFEAAHTGMEEHLSTLVAAGVLTQEQADAHLAVMQEHWNEMPMFTGEGFGMMLGAGRGGMWGNHGPHGMVGRGS